MLKWGYFEVCELGEGFEIFDLFLDLVDRAVEFVELLEFEQTVADGALEKYIHNH
jgi:hypothetical protein